MGTTRSENPVRTHTWDHGLGRGPLTTDTKPGPWVTTSTLTAPGLGRDGLVPRSCPAPQPHGDPSWTWDREDRLQSRFAHPRGRDLGSRWGGHPDLGHQRPRASVQDPAWAAPTSQVTTAGQPPAGGRSPSPSLDHSKALVLFSAFIGRSRHTPAPERHPGVVTMRRRAVCPQASPRGGARAGGLLLKKLIDDVAYLGGRAHAERRPGPLTTSASPPAALTSSRRAGRGRWF